MTTDQESDEDEQTPLLLPPEASRSPDEASSDVGSRAAFYLALALIGLFQAGLAASVVPATALMENALCERQNGSLRDCKGEAVQSELAMLKGIASLTLLIPGKIGGSDGSVPSIAKLIPPQVYSLPFPLVPLPTVMGRVPSWR